MRNICQRNFDVQFYLRFLYLLFPHLRCLHADSITCAIHTPKMTITRSFITRALSHSIATTVTHVRVHNQTASSYLVRV